MDLITEIVDRATPGPAGSGLTGWGVLAVLVIAAVAATWWPAWRVLRLAVTLVHELGHALVGVAAGRRFTGFVLRSDMSGHAVTVGPARGLGIVATTWAGYPAPGLLGGLLVWLVSRGWAAPTLTILLIGLLASFAYVRSVLTGVVVVTVTAAVAALWWWRDEAVQHHVLAAIGIVLLVGAWRHLVTVLGRPEPTSDPGALARFTGVPSVLWQASFALVLGLSTWLAVAGVLSMLSG